jgi:hypothetical protein
MIAPLCRRRQRHDDRRHQRGERQGDKTGPDHAAVARVAVHLGQDVAENIGQREEQHAGQKGHVAEDGNVHGGQLRRADQVGAQQDAHVRRHEEVVVAKLAAARRAARASGAVLAAGLADTVSMLDSCAIRMLPCVGSVRQAPRQCNRAAAAGHMLRRLNLLQIGRPAEVRHLFRIQSRCAST